MADERNLTDHEPRETAENDRTMRLAECTQDATRAFGDAGKAMRWLRKPNRVLGGQKPIDLLATARGVDLVRQLLGNVEYGGVA